MKKGMKLFLAGAAVAVAAGVLARKKYLDSYVQVDEENEFDEAMEESDFVPMEEIDDGFDIEVEEIDEDLFEE